MNNWFSIYRFVISLGLASMLGACASLSKDECLTADWQLIGYEDGLKGSRASRIGEHREACAKHGITPNKSAYDLGYDEGIRRYCSHSLGVQTGQAGSSVLLVCPSDSDFHIGYEQGLEKYCTYDVGYQQGVSGRSYYDVCPNRSEEEFLAGYDLGKHIFSLQSLLRSLDNDLANVLKDQEANEKNIERTKNRITYDDELNSEQRRGLLERLEEYNELTVELEAAHIDIEVEMEAIRRELAEINRGSL